MQKIDIQFCDIKENGNSILYEYTTLVLYEKSLLQLISIFLFFQKKFW